VGHFYSIIPLSAGILLRYQNHSTVVIDEVGLGFEGKDERCVLDREGESARIEPVAGNGALICFRPSPRLIPVFPLAGLKQDQSL